MYFKCCVPNCVSKRQDASLHKFPSDEAQRNKWLETINCNELRNLDSANLVSLLVCHKHFENRFYTAKSGVKKSAYPTLFSAKEIKDGIPSKSFNFDDKEKEQTDHTYSRKRHYDHSYCKPLKSHSDSQKHQEPLTEITNIPSTSTSTSSHLKNLDGTAGKMASQDTPGLSSPSTPKRCKKRLIQKFDHLTPSCKHIYTAYKKSRRLLHYTVRAKKSLAVNKERSFEELTKDMNPIAKKFFDMQIKMCRRRKKGRRFSQEEKMFALSILKQSPKAYQFLQKIFVLPSNTTLKKMIAELDIKAGINTQTFEVIKEEVSGWDDNKKMCTIMFDEMALEPSLVYSYKNDSINGFLELNDSIPISLLT